MSAISSDAKHPDTLINYSIIHYVEPNDNKKCKLSDDEEASEDSTPLRDRVSVCLFYSSLLCSNDSFCFDACLFVCLFVCLSLDTWKVFKEKKT